MKIIKLIFNIISIIFFIMIISSIGTKVYKVGIRSDFYKETFHYKKENKGLVEQKLPSKDMWNKMMKEKNNKK